MAVMSWSLLLLIGMMSMVEAGPVNNQMNGKSPEYSENPRPTNHAFTGDQRRAGAKLEQYKSLMARQRGHSYTPKEDGTFILGDIALREDQVDAMIREAQQGQQGRPWKRAVVLGPNYSNYYWPTDMNICWHIDSSCSNTYSSSHVQTIRNALQEIEDNTCLTFTETDAGTSCYNSNTHAIPDIEIQCGSGCWSYIGKNGGSQQALNLQHGNGGTCVVNGIVVHEFFHLLGQYHEQSHPDRDSYVTVNFDNIRNGYEGNFNAQSASVIQEWIYDYESVMHYGPYSFSSNGLPVIEAVDQQYQNTMGQRYHGSPQDYHALNTAYQCFSDSCALDCEYGIPNGACSSCILCERFAQGSLCDQLKPSTASVGSCGGTISLSASDIDTERCDLVTTPNFPNAYSAGDECHWSIQAPGGSRIKYAHKNRGNLATSGFYLCYHFFAVHNPSTSATAWFCGTGDDVEHVSVTNELYISFVTEQSATINSNGAQMCITLQSACESGGNPCQNGGSCQVDLTCLCPAGFTGDLCETEVVDPCDPNLCQNSGTCNPDGSSYTCTCQAGYRGDNCQNADPCNPNPCQNSGTCASSTDYSTYECTCQSGFAGTNCENEDPCNATPCQNGGSCDSSDDFTSYECTCQSGYGGTNCENEDPCNAAPCLNGGSCTPSGDYTSYSCQCAHGYTGNTCADTDPCAGNNCDGHATCTASSGSFTCDCNEGYSGDGVTCTEICTPTRCQNNGVCSVNGDTYCCTCRRPWTGSTCGTYNRKGSARRNYCPSDTNECSFGTDTCSARSDCVNKIGGYLCLCHDGYSGPNCANEIDHCEDAPCQNGGTCESEGSSYACACTSGWTGKNCEVDASDMCASGPCENGGTCTNGDTMYTCACQTNYIGDQCEQYDYCAAVSCQNGGTCDNLASAYKCRCPSGWTGDLCDTQQPTSCSTNPSLCQNGSRCRKGKCQCRKGTYGTFCENRR